MGQDKAGLTALLTGPTNCANDFTCRVEVNKNLNEIQGVYDGYNSVNLLFNVVPAIMMSIALPAAGGAAMEWLGLGGAGGTSNATALSIYRYTQEGETFIRYESANPAFTKVTSSGGVAPNTFAAPSSDGLIPLADRIRFYNLPSAQIPRPNVITLTPPQGTLIIGPRPVVGGPGNEVIFPIGY